MLTTFGSVSILILVLASPGYSQSAKLTKLGLPQPASVAGYHSGHCVKLGHQLRICKLLSDDKDTFLVEKEGKPFGGWPGGSYLGETSDFEVLRGDLDGDRRAELIVANRDSTSAGMGVNHWTIAIFPDAEFGSFNPPLSFSVQDYGSFGTFVASGGAVNILTTRWMSMKGKGKRPVGLYLVGQWWRYKSGELYPVLNRQIVARRCLASFERERLRTMESAQVPYKWLTNPNTELLSADPTLNANKQTEKRGIIETVSVRNIDSDRAMKLIFKLDTGRSNRYVYAYDRLEEGEFELRFIGDGATGKIYPERYLPSSPQDWLTGRRATLVSYGNASTDSDVFDILWLEPK